MKLFLLISAVLVSMNSFAQSKLVEHAVERANSVVMARDEKGPTMTVNYSTGGCSRKENEARIVLEHVSTKDITPEWALKEDPNTLHEYEVVMKAVVKEKMGMCRMAYDITVSASLADLFRTTAPSLGIDLPAKKAHYSVTFLSPEVVGYETFSAFDN